MSKAIEKNKKKVTTNISIYIGNLCVQTKIMIRTKWGYPLSFQNFLNCWKTAMYTKILKFSDLQFVFVYTLWKIKRNCMNGLFCMTNLLEVGRIKHFQVTLELLKSQKAKKK